jgi:hypothetical protein
VRRPEEVDVRAEVLAEQVEAEASAVVCQTDARTAAELPVGPRLDAADLPVQFRRHVETLQDGADTVKHGGNLARTVGAPSKRC